MERTVSGGVGVEGVVKEEKVTEEKRGWGAVVQQPDDAPSICPSVCRI